MVEGAGNVAEVEADVGAAQREVGVEPWAHQEQWPEPPDVLELACGLGLVTALIVRERSCGVRDRAVDRVVEVLLGCQPARFDRPSLRVSPLAQLGGREDQIAEREDPSVAELASVCRKRE